jgi:WD40 repeat protein
LRPGGVKLWDAATGQPLPLQLSGPSDNVDRAVLSPDGTRLAASQSNHTVLVWDLATGGLVTLEGPATHVARTVCFSPDGKRLLYEYRPNNDAPLKDAPRSVWIWDLPRRQAVVTIDRISYGEFAQCFSPDGKLIVTTGSNRGLVKVWDAATGHEAFSCKDPDAGLLVDAVFSPDGRRLATASIDGTVRIWDLGTGQEVLKLSDVGRYLSSVRFVSDGRCLISSSSDRQIAVWDATPIRD